VDSDLRSNIRDDMETLKGNNIQVLFWEEDLAPLLAKQPSKRPPKELRAGMLERDPFLYIYTSGTTGNSLFV
jgi:acyl-coenzyme A synthetase/AMP-(fatty) acid ligase